VMSALVLCTDGRVVAKEDEDGDLMWRDESEVPKSCWKYYFEVSEANDCNSSHN